MCNECSYICSSLTFKSFWWVLYKELQAYYANYSIFCDTLCKKKVQRRERERKKKQGLKNNVLAFLIGSRPDYFRSRETIKSYAKLPPLLCHANMDMLAHSQIRTVFPSLLNTAVQQALFLQNTLFWLITPGPHWIWMTSKRVYQVLVTWLPVRAQISIKHDNEVY